MSPTYVLKSCPKQRTWNAQRQWQCRPDKPQNGAEKVSNVSSEIGQKWDLARKCVANVCFEIVSTAKDLEHPNTVAVKAGQPRGSS